MYPVELIIHRISSHTRGENPDYPGRIYFLVYKWMGYNLREGGSLQGGGEAYKRPFTADSRPRN